MHGPENLASNHNTQRSSLFVAAFIPLLAVALIACFSPNFDVTHFERSSPLGSDFLQEYVGATILNSEESAKLYDPEHSNAVQHNPAIVGFRFPEANYYPMVYPPFYYWLLRPLAYFPYVVAMRIWMACLAACLALQAWAVARYFSPARSFAVFLPIAAIGFAPVLVSLTMAHKSVVLLLILTGTYLFLYHERKFTAGLVFGLIAFKPHLAVLFGCAMLWKRQWRFVGGAATTVSLLVLLCGAAGIDISVDYFKQCVGMGDYLATGGYRLGEAHGLSGVMRLMLSDIAPAMIKPATLALSALTALLALLTLRGELDTRSETFSLQFSNLVLATILLSPHFYFYDLTIIWLPMVLLATSLVGSWKTKSLRWAASARNRLLLLLLGLFGLSGWFTEFADATRVQLSLPLLLTLMFVLAIKCSATSAKSVRLSRTRRDATYSLNTASR